MKIKLALLDTDANYLKRIVAVFNNKFANELEIYSSTDIEAAMQYLIDKKIDVFLANSSFKIDFSAIPKKCGFAYLVESLDINKIDEYKAVCKFQKVELIYKQILSIYSEQVPNIIGISNTENGSMKTIVFASPCGGAGSSTSAAACAITLAGIGYRVLYLNLETYGSADMYFSCDGHFDFADVIYAVKSNKTNRAMKLQSTVKQDATGVFFYSSVNVPLDMMEMSNEDYTTLQNELKMLGSYDYVIMDMEFPQHINDFKFYQSCNSVVITADVSESSSIKIEKMLRAVQIIDSQSEFSIQPKMWMLLNKVQNNEMMQADIHVLGSFPIYQQVSPMQIARQLSLSGVFEQLI